MAKDGSSCYLTELQLQVVCLTGYGFGVNVNGLRFCGFLFRFLQVFQTCLQSVDLPRQSLYVGRFLRIAFPA